MSLDDIDYSDWDIDPDEDYWVRVTAVPKRGPHLRAAKKRIKRVGVQLTELVELIEEFEEDNETALRVVVDPQATDERERFSFDWSEHRPPPIFDIAIVVGEVVYNLRVALDYLVHALSWLDDAEPNKRSQFPIETDEEAFWIRRSNILRGINDDHCRQLQDYQPFAGCTWITTLKNLSNPDKHRNLTVVNPRWEARVRLRDLELESQSDGTLVAVLPDQRPHVVLEGNLPVIETLAELTTHVASVLERFQGDFGESGTFTLRLPN